jgi:hypothetical protein
MNKVCAAGTGSFIEEQSERLGVKLKSGEFNRLAMAADEPPAMGERCTVFIETDINRNQQRGVQVDDLCAGLCYSIVQNYLNRVVEDHKIGDVILFQGGTAYNRGVKAAFEKVTGKPIIVPPHHDVMGAIGMALLARDWYQQTATSSTRSTPSNVKSAPTAARSTPSRSRATIPRRCTTAAAAVNSMRPSAKASASTCRGCSSSARN